MFNKYAIYRHFKGMLYLPLMSAKSVVDNQMQVIYMALYHYPNEEGKQSICARPFYGEDGFFEPMPDGRDFYANEKDRLEEIDWVDLYMVEKLTGASHGVDGIELLGSDLLEITSINNDVFYIDINSKEDWDRYEIVERR